MRFSLFIVCFFYVFFSANAQKHILEKYHREAFGLDKSVNDSVIQFGPTAFSYLIITPTYINSVNKKGRFNDIDYKWAFSSSTSIYPNLVTPHNLCNLLDNRFSEIHLFAGFTSLVSIGQKKYGVRNDSLYFFNRTAKHFVYHPIQSVYTIKNRLYIWSKAGSLFELKSDRLHKLYTSDSQIIKAPTKLIASANGLIALYHKPFGIALITNNQLNWIVPFSKKTFLLSSTLFDGKLFVLRNDGVIKVLEDSRIGKFQFLDINYLFKPLAIASDQKNRLVILFRDSILTYSKKATYTKEPFKFEKIFPVNGNYLCFSKYGSYGWNNRLLHTPNEFLRGNVFQLWHSENSDIDIVNENGIVKLNETISQIVSYKKIRASHSRSVFGGFWILNNDTFQFIHVINSKLDIIQQFLYKGAKPISFESDVAGNLWIVCKDSLLFYSVRSMKISPVKLLKPCHQVQLFEVNNNLLISINQVVYKCTTEGSLVELKWNGDIMLLPTSSILTFRDVNSKNKLGISTLYINHKYVTYIYKIELNDDVIQTRLLANYQSDQPIIDVFAKLPIITLFTAKQAVTLDVRQFNHASVPIIFQREVNSLPINFNTIRETVDKAPRHIYFQYNNTDEYEDGFYQIKLEPFDSCWINCANNQLFPFPQLKKGIYKLHVRYCSGDGLVLSQSTLLIDIDDSIWFKKQMLFLYIPILIGLLILLIHILYRIKIFYKLKIEEYVIQRTSVINEEKHKLQKLLEAFVPREASNEIIEKGKTTYKRFDGVSVLFADIEGFSIIAEDIEPELLITQLDDLFYRFDYITGKYGIEKIKTIGDAYMCAGGLPVKRSSNPVEMILAAMEMLDYVNHLTIRIDFNWKIRIGIHTGTVIAGVIGQKKLAYDIWGDTVNVANRIESSSVAGRINISIETFKLVKDFFECEYRGRIPIKNRGEIEMYFVKGIHPWLVVKRKPNAEFNLHLQLIGLNDLSEIVFADIDKNMPANRYFHTAEYIHHIYSRSISIGNKMGLTPDNQIVLQTASLCLFYGMIEHYDNYLQGSIAYVRKHLPEYKYNNAQIDLICETLTVVNSLNPNTIIETLLLEIVYAYWGDCYFTEQIRALYIEESEMLERLSWNNWLELKLNRFEQVLKHIDLDRAQFEIAPDIQIRKLKAIKI